MNKPQFKAICLSTLKIKPRKPNSANRTILLLSFNSKLIKAYLPGTSCNIQKNTMVLVIPKPLKDCPGIKYRVIRGTLGVPHVINRSNSKSKY